MIPQKHKALLQHLTHKSEKGDASWYTTSVEDQYGLRLKRGALLLDKFYGFDEGPESYTIESYSLAIINEKGERADRIAVEEGTADFQLLKDAYEAAHRAYWKVYEVLADMIKELETEDKVGLEPPPDDELNLQF